MALKFLKDFKKTIAKLDSVGVGIRTTETWLSTGNFALNRALSGDFVKGIPLGKITLLAGPSGSGKSFIASNFALQAQLVGYHVLYLDSEHAIDVDYLSKIGVDVSEEKLTYISVATIEDVNSILSGFFSGYTKEHGKDNYGPDVQKTIVVLDSLAMLSSQTEMVNYDTKGEIKSDQGILAKRRKAMLRLAVGHLGRLPITMLVTDHVYPQDIMNSTKFSSSIIGIVTKLKLKEEGEVTGVRIRFETYKSRFAKLGTKVELDVPYNRGMSSTSGLLELLEESGVIAKGTQPGEKSKYIAEVGDERFAFKENELDSILALKLLKHPACAPMLARSAPQVVLGGVEVDVNPDDIDAIVDQDEAPLELKKGRKAK
jgi:recombination protein RecA